MFRPVACAVTVALVLGACNGDDASRVQGDQPSPGRTPEFVPGGALDLPEHPRLHPLDSGARGDGLTVRSYESDLPPETALDDYSRLVRAEGWAVVSPAAPTGPEAYQAVYTRDGFTLVVSTASAPTVADSEGRGTQLSLSMFDPGVTPSTLAPLG